MPSEGLRPEDIAWTKEYGKEAGWSDQQINDTIAKGNELMRSGYFKDAKEADGPNAGTPGIGSMPSMVHTPPGLNAPSPLRQGKTREKEQREPGE